VVRKVGARIRELRIDAGLRQQDLAEKLSVSVPTISAYENSVNQINADDLPRFADALGVPASWLLAEDADLERERMVLGFVDYFKAMLSGPAEQHTPAADPPHKNGNASVVNDPVRSSRSRTAFGDLVLA
jgi:transcriptional regulator with XRE-family HTH domain